MLPALERDHDVLAPTLAGHAGGPDLDGPVDEGVLADAVEAAMDEAGFETAHFAGNSLGGYMALHLAARGRARSVVALAPSGGWVEGDDAFNETLDYFEEMQELLRNAIQAVELIVTSPQGRRRATEYIATNSEHIPSELIAHQMLGAAGCPAVVPLIERARAEGWYLEPQRIDCPVRVVWGTADRILEWPRAAARYRSEWLPNADWVELDGIGHCPQLDVPTETAQLILDFARR